MKSIEGYLVSHSRVMTHRPLSMVVYQLLSGKLPSASLVIGVLISVASLSIWFFIGAFDFVIYGVDFPYSMHYAGQALYFSLIYGYMIGSCAHLINCSVACFDSIRPHVPLLNSDAVTCVLVRRAILLVRSDYWFLYGFAGFCFGSILALTYSVESEPSFYEMIRHPQRYSLMQLVLPIQAIFFHALAFQFAYFIIRIGLLFNDFGKTVEINLLNIEALKPFGRFAVSSTRIIVVGALLTPLLWLGEPAELWTDIRAAVLFWLPVTVAVFWLPMWNLSSRLKQVKIRELELLQRAIGGDRSALEESSIRAESGAFRLPQLLVWRDQVDRISTLPIDIPLFYGFAVHALTAVILSSGAWVLNAVLHSNR